jgi:hypothetical protein
MEGIMRSNESTMRMVLVAKGFGAAAAYLGAIATLMYPVVQAAGLLG